MITNWWLLDFICFARWWMYVCICVHILIIQVAIYVNKDCSLSVIEHMYIYVGIVLTQSSRWLVILIFSPRWPSSICIPCRRERPFLQSHKGMLTKQHLVVRIQFYMYGLCVALLHSYFPQFYFDPNLEYLLGSRLRVL